MFPKKHKSGAQKKRKRKLEDELRESQKGVIHKFFFIFKECRSLSRSGAGT
jgi:hypothetical protein